MGFDNFFSDFENFAPSRNGSHLELHNFCNLNTIDIPQTHSRFSALVTRTEANEDSNQRRVFFDEFFSDFKDFAPSRNGGHLELHIFCDVITIDIPAQTHSCFSGLVTCTEANEDSNQRRGIGLR